jgi:hypothetical protein
MLKKREVQTTGAATPMLRQGLLAKLGAGQGTIDRRTFLKRSGIGVGAGAVAGALPFGMVKKAQVKSKSNARYVRIVRLAVLPTRLFKTGYGFVKTLCLKARLTWVHIAPKGQHCANMVMASIV